MAVQMQWDPNQYLTFGDHRLRPFVELIQRIQVESPADVVDLGCGPGNATVLLCAKWPDAKVVGIDNSAEMIDEATELEVEGRLVFELGDVRDFAPERPVDVIVSNATLQWVPGHIDFFSSLVSTLGDGGALAFQVPGMHLEPSHALLADLARNSAFKERLIPQIRMNAIESTERYIEVLSGLGCDVDAWETRYFQLLQGEDAVLEWTKGSSLRPFTSVLEPDEAASFVEEYRQLLDETYPLTAIGTLYPFRRVFVVAHKRG